MLIRSLVAFTIFFINDSLACTLPDEKPIQIACSVACGDSYRDALRRAAQIHGYQVEFSTIPRGEGMLKHLQNMDALVSPGGHDINPKYFTKKLSGSEREELFRLHDQLGNEGNSTAAHLARDEHEYRVMREYFANEKMKSLPLLGVCYGMQMMAAANDIPLYIDIEEKFDDLTAQRRTHNQIDFLSSDKGRLTQLPKRFRAYKYHHQAVDKEFIDRLPESERNIRVFATSFGGRIPEIIEAKNRPAVGVQFHSESPNQEDKKVADAVYGWLLKQACQHRVSKMSPSKTEKALPLEPQRRPIDN